MGSSSKPEKAKQSAQERQLARRGARMFNEFVTQDMPLILRQARDARGSDAERRDLREQAVEATEARIPRARTLAARSPGGMGGGQAVAGLSRSVAAAPGMTSAQVQAGESALEQRGVAGLARAVSQGHRALRTPGSAGLAAGGQLATERGIQKMYADVARAQRRTSALMGLAGMGYQAGQENGWWQSAGQPPEYASGGEAHAAKLASNRGLGDGAAD